MSGLGDIDLSGSGPDGGYTADDLDRLFQNTNPERFNEWEERPRWHAQRAVRRARLDVRDIGENCTVGSGNDQAQAAVRARLESLLHEIAAIAEGSHPAQADLTQAP